MAAELYVWKAPRPADAAEAAALVEAWHAGDQADPGRGPFEASTDVIFFSRELTGDAPPIWNPDQPAKAGPHPNRVMVVPLEQTTVQETLGDVYSLALKYDVVVYDPQRGVVNVPHEEMSAYASATYWPRGAIRSVVAGLIGAAMAVGAWVAGIPILSGILIVIGVFLVVLTVATFVSEARKRAATPTP